MNVLITGATGLVGSAMCKTLRGMPGYRITAICRDDDKPLNINKIIRGDIEDLRTCYRAVAESNPDIVFHLAAQAIVPIGKRNPYGTFETNVRGTYNLFEAIRTLAKKDVVVVVASSDKAYGEISNEDGLYREDDKLDGIDPYEASKVCTDVIAKSYALSYGIKTAVIRAGNIYGKNDQDLTRIIPSAVKSIKENKTVDIMSDGSPVRDYLYIDDAVNGYILAAKYMIGAETPFEAFNIAGGEPVSVIELVELMWEIFYNKPMPTIKPSILYYIYGTRVEEISRQILDTTKAQDTLKWKPAFSLKKGLEILLNE